MKESFKNKNRNEMLMKAIELGGGQKEFFKIKSLKENLSGQCNSKYYANRFKLETERKLW